MTKDEILEFVKNAGLKPADIVAKSNGLIPVTQAYDWLRTWKFSMSTLLLLEVYAKRVAGSAEIFSEPVSSLLPGARIKPGDLIWADDKKTVLVNPSTGVYIAGIDPYELKEPAFITDATKKVDLSEKKVPAKKSIADLKREVPSLKTASEIPATKAGVERARYAGESYDTTMDMKYRVISDNIITFWCDKKSWQVSKSMKECYAGVRLVKMSELSLA